MTPPHIQHYVDVLGEDLAIRFILRFGGSVVYLADNPQARSMLSELLSAEQIRALARASSDRLVRVPTGKPWLALRLHENGESVAAIARRLHVADWTVRRWLAAARNQAQADLFD